MDAVPDALYLKDTQSRFLQVNTATVRLLGAVTAEEVVGKTDFDFAPP
jgi:PAS domain S-box-containing protein